MITCPKCGFEQPKDRFCAKCGVVMEGFTPKKLEAPSYGTPAVFFGVVGLVLLLLGLYGYLHRRTVAERESVEVTETEPTPSPRSAPSRRTQAPASAIAPFANVAQSPAHGGNTPPVAAGPSQEVTLEFDMITREVLDRLTQNSDGRVSVGQYGVAIIPQFREKFEGIHSDPGFHPLDSESRPLSLNEPSTVFRGGREPKTNEAIGITIEATYLHALEPAGGGEYHLVIKRALPDYSSPADSKVVVQTSDETLKLPGGSAAIITGMLARKPSFAEGEEDLYRGNILRAFLEPAFQRGDGDLILIFNPLPTDSGQSNAGLPPGPPPPSEQNFQPPPPAPPETPVDATQQPPQPQN